MPKADNARTTSRRALLASAALAAPASLLPALAAAAAEVDPAACPVVAVARRVKALDVAHHRLDVRCCALRGVGPEAARLGEAMAVISDRICDAEDGASRLRAVSF